MHYLFQINITLFKNLLHLILFAVISSVLLPSVALSKDYKVEILVFENLIEHQTYESYKHKEIEEIDTESEVWLIEPTMLLEEVVSFEESEDYLLLHHYSWGQESLDYNETAVVNLTESNISGWVKIYANQLLYVNLDLDFKGYRMSEKRRIKLDEKHFFDHPKFGILIQVSRLEEDEENLELDGGNELQTNTNSQAGN